MKLLRRAATRVVVLAAALGAVVTSAVAPSAAARPVAGHDAGKATTAERIIGGVYSIVLRGEESALLTSDSDEQGSPTLLLPPLGEPGYQEWAIASAADGSYTIKNLRSGLYLGLDGAEPAPHRFVLADTRPFRWHIRPGSAPNRVIISVAESEDELRLDLSPLLIYPPRAALQQPRSDRDQEWELNRHE